MDARLVVLRVHMWVQKLVVQWGILTAQLLAVKRVGQLVVK
jgi:hypothetical protein